MEPHQVPDGPTPAIADDLLLSADEIAEYILGKKGGRRKVYYLAKCTRLSVFRLGSARKSVLLGWISGQGSRALPPPGASNKTA